MVVLGINGGFRPGYQDVSAALVIDGRVVAAVEEERLSRIKFSAGRLPYLSVIEVLKTAQLTIKQVDLIAFHGSTWGDEIESRVEDYFIYHFGHCPPILRFHHHDCHAASAYYASGFEKALVLTIDNSGDGISTQIAIGESGQLKTLKQFDRQNSLGFFYSLITQFCGFVKDSDEYKLMGLASYGNKTAFDFSWLIDVKDRELQLNQDFINAVTPKAPALHRDEMNFNQRFLEKIGSRRRLPQEEIVQFYKDVAASAQQHLETLVLKLIKQYSDAHGTTKVCLAGGVALNCVMNQAIMNAEFVDDVFIQPAAGDAGISMGAAWLASVRNGIKPVQPETTYLGPEFNTEEIKTTLQSCGLRFTELSDAASTAAKLLAEKKVIGWFQGRMEFGPRALGNRSILALPTDAKMQQTVNLKIKLRESFRPFCPSILEEDAPIYFEGKKAASPYMTITYKAKEPQCLNIPAVIHVDGTARIQTVNPSQNSLYYNLLQRVKQLTGHGVLLNTSFNLSHEPIVCSPRHAIATFYSSGLDALVIGNFLVVK